MNPLTVDDYAWARQCARKQIDELTGAMQQLREHNPGLDLSEHEAWIAENREREKRFGRAMKEQMLGPEPVCPDEDGLDLYDYRMAANLIDERLERMRHVAKLVEGGQVGSLYKQEIRRVQESRARFLLVRMRRFSRA